MTSEERLAILKQMALDCKGKEGANDDDLNEVLARKLPTTTGSKCIHACIHEAIGIIKDNKMHPDAAVEVTAKAYNNDEKAIAFVKEITHECGSVTDADRCEFASKLVTCVHEGVIKRGVDPVTAL